MKNFLRIYQILLISLLVFTTSQRALAKVEISIRNNFSNKTKILVSGLEESPILIRGEVDFFRKKLLVNLATTGLFQFISYNDFKKFQSSELAKSSENPESKTSSLFSLKRELAIGEIPDFSIYEKADIDNIAIFAISANMVGNIEIHLKIWDVAQQKELVSKMLISSRFELGEAAKIVANQLFVSLTNEEKGHFNSPIAYVSETGSLKKRIKKLCLIDLDGSNQQCLTDGKEMVLTPIFSRKIDELFYVRYFHSQPQIFSINTKSKQTRKIGGYRNTTLAPSPNPVNPQILLLTAIDDGNSDIHLLDLSANSAKRLTKSSAIDTTASFSPDGKNIIFTSDREGGQQIFRMNLDGSSVERISRGTGTYAKPQFSPNGKLIAFTKINKNKFSIGIMDESGQNEKILTSDYLVEGARWSVNGRYLIYSKKSSPYGKESIPRLFVIDVITGFEYQIPTPENEGAVDPDWGWN